MLWLAGAVVVWGVTAGAEAFAGGGGLYSAFRHGHYVFSLAVVFATMAGIYFLLDVAKTSYRRALAWSHFILMSAGTTLIFTPLILFRLLAMPSGDNALRTFVAFNLISTFGYVVTLAASALFLALIGDVLIRAIRRLIPPNPAPPA